MARYAALNAGYWRQLERGEITKAELLTQRFQVFFQQEGLPCPDPAAFNRTYQDYLGETVVFLDHSDQLLRDLHSQVKQYAVTNGSPAGTGKETGLVRPGGVAGRGVHLGDPGGGKAQPGLFPAGAPGHWPLGAGEEILLIGDSLTSDMAGGNRAGIPCCWYNPQGQPIPGDLDIRYDIRNLNEVREIVEASKKEGQVQQ